MTVPHWGIASYFGSLVASNIVGKVAHLASGFNPYFLAGSAAAARCACER